MTKIIAKMIILQNIAFSLFNAFGDIAVDFSEDFL